MSITANKIKGIRWARVFDENDAFTAKNHNGANVIAFGINLDIDESENIAKRYRVFSVPTLVCFRSGKKLDSMVGLNSFDDVVEFVKRCKEMKLED